MSHLTLGFLTSVTLTFGAPWSFVVKGCCVIRNLATSLVFTYLMPGARVTCENQYHLHILYNDPGWEVALYPNPTLWKTLFWENVWRWNQVQHVQDLKHYRACTVNVQVTGWLRELQEMWKHHQHHQSSQLLLSACPRISICQVFNTHHLITFPGY